jgi:hypothetical protein
MASTKVAGAAGEAVAAGTGSAAAATPAKPVAAARTSIELDLILRLPSVMVVVSPSF